MKTFVADSRCRSLAIGALLLIGSTIAARAAVLPDAPIPQNATQPQSTAVPVPAHTNGLGDVLFPDRFTVDPGIETQPLTVKQKFGGYAREQLGLSPFLAAGVSGAISQGLDSDPQYGQGWEAYGKRVGAILIEGESVAILREGFFPSILHQDPRFYRKGSGGLVNRAVYAATRTLITRQDSGKRAFNFSSILASGGAAGLTLAYYPDRSQNTTQVFETFASNVGGIAITNVFREFGPEIKHKLFHRDID